MSNALKFTPTGGRVTARLQREGDNARFTVEDSGVGIEPELLARLFTPFEKNQAISSRQPLGDGDTEIGASRFVFKCVSAGNLG